MAKQNRAGFTLVELLVVITIIGILAAMLLPAVNAVREQGRKSQCQNNLRQIALATKAHLAEQGHYPTGGWGRGREGSSWAGDPDRGFSRRQPGGWCYNILPYMGETRLHDIGEGGDGPGNTAVRAALPFYICTTRRQVRAYPYTRSEGYTNCSVSDGQLVGKSDYAMCAGTTFPGTVEEPSDPEDAEDFNWSPVSQNGVSYYRSEVRDSQVDAEDGESNQYLVGEKYLNKLHYLTGKARADDESWNVGFSYDIYAWAVSLPLNDRANRSHDGIFGGPHPSGWQAAFCDGSVHSINWGIKSQIHRRLGSRNDGEPVDHSAY